MNNSGLGAFLKIFLQKVLRRFLQAEYTRGNYNVPN